MVLRYESDTPAPPEVVWALLARPDQWADWAPHVRGAWGLGDPEVRPGARGAARLLGVVPIPARITAVDEGRSWTWVVGAGPARVTMDHEAEPRPTGGTCVAVTLRAAAPVERLLELTYGPLVQRLVDRLAGVATRRAASRHEP